MNGQKFLVIAATIYTVAGPVCAPASADNSSSGLDSRNAFGRTGATMLNATAVPDLQASSEMASAEQGLGTNPLWGVPLGLLSATRDRPLFSPSRRPPAAVVTGLPPKVIKVVNQSAPPKPTLNLVGIVEGSSEGYAVFIDTTTHNTVRLKTGEGEDGWVLRSVSEREAVLYKNDRTEVLELPPLKGRPDK